jgi:CubicO group peptidase (beta-lactamase class C family)
VGTGALSKAGLARMADVMAGHVETGGVPGLVWLVARRGEVHSGVAGTMLAGGGGGPVARDTIFRISSMTKPVTAVATLVLVEECRLRLDDPVDPWLPELADRRVVADVNGPLTETVPAVRPLSVRDLLTFRMGLGGDFTGTVRQPAMEELARRDVGAGPPAPALPPPPDEWMARIGSVPLEYQPGERWLYHTGADVLGVLIARASGSSFPDFLAERILEPLGMVDTAFSVPAGKAGRFGPCYWRDPGPDGEVRVYDPADGQWATPPAFPGGGAGLVSTVDDMAAFGEMLLAGGTYHGKRILSRPSVAAMTMNHLTAEQIATSGPSPTGDLGWGFGVGVQIRRTGPARSVGTYGWDGGMGTQWANDPAEDLVGVVMANQMWSSPQPPPAFQDFWTCAYAAIDD